MNLFNIEAVIKLRAAGLKGELTKISNQSTEAANAFGELVKVTNAEKRAAERLAKILPSITFSDNQLKRVRNMTKALGALATAYQSVAKAQADIRPISLGRAPSVPRRSQSKNANLDMYGFRGGEKVDSTGFTKSEREHLIDMENLARKRLRQEKDLLMQKKQAELDSIRLVKDAAIDRVNSEKAATSKIQADRVANARAMYSAIERLHSGALADEFTSSKRRIPELTSLTGPLASIPSTDATGQSQRALSRALINQLPSGSWSEGFTASKNRIPDLSDKGILSNLPKTAAQRELDRAALNNLPSGSWSEGFSASRRKIPDLGSNLLKGLPETQSSHPAKDIKAFGAKQYTKGFDMAAPMQDVTRQINDHIGALNKYDAAKKKLTKTSNETASAITKTGKAVKTTSGLLKGFGGILTTIGNIAVGMTVFSVFMGIANGIREAVSAASEFQVAIRDMNALAKVSEPELMQVAERFRTITERTGMALDPTEVMRGVRSLFAAGYEDLGQASQIAEQGAVLARVTGMDDIQKGIELLGSTMKAYGADASQAEHFTNILINSTDQGLVTMEQMYQSFGRAAPIAAQAGISMEELASLVGTVTSKGVRTETAVTGIAAAITNLMNQTKPAKDTLAKYGLEINETTIRAKGLLQTLVDINTAVGGSSEAIGEIVGAQRGKVAVNAILGDAKIAKTNIEKVDVAGTAEARKREIVKTSSEQWDIVIEQIKSAFMWLGMQVDKLLAEAIKSFSNIKPELNNLFDVISVILKDIISSFAGSDSSGLKASVVTLTEVFWTLHIIASNLMLAFKHFSEEVVDMIATLKGEESSTGIMEIRSEERQARIAEVQKKLAAPDEELKSYARSVGQSGDPSLTLDPAAIKHINDKKTSPEYLANQRLLDKLQKEEIEAQKMITEAKKTLGQKMVENVERLEGLRYSAVNDSSKPYYEQYKPQGPPVPPELLRKPPPNNFKPKPVTTEKGKFSEELELDMKAKFKKIKHEGYVGATGLNETLTAWKNLLALAQEYTGEKDFQMKIEKEIFNVTKAQEKVAQKKLAEAAKARRAELKAAKENIGKAEAEFGDDSLEAKIAALDYEFMQYERNEENKYEVAKLYAKKRAQIEKEFNDNKEAATISLRAVTVENEAAVLESRGETEKADKLRRQQTLDEEVQGIKERVEAMQRAGVDELEITKYIESEKRRLRLQSKQDPKEPNKVMDPSEYKTDPRGQAMVEGSPGTSFSGIGGDFSKVGATAWSTKNKKKAKDVYDPATSEAIVKIDKIDRKVKVKDLPKDHQMHPDNYKSQEEKDKEMTVNVIIREEDANGNVILRTNNKAQGERKEGTYERGRT